MFTALYNEKQKLLPTMNWIIYHTGRISTYALWGLLFGSMGASVKWFGLQQNISVSIGVGILTILIAKKLFPSLEHRISEFRLIKNIRAHLIPHIGKKTKSASLLGGVVNGLLPCGLVYMALAGATAVQDPIQGGVFMILFGIGTLPLLITALVIGHKINLPMRKYLTRWYPILIGLMAIMLIIRGMNLGNMLSPALTPSENAAVHCVGND
jgi:sulfite exporter TauE/SafE